MRVLILTGAGISAESGIPTFRGSDGLWEGHRVEDVATPEGFAKDPALVHSFYNGRRRRLLESDIAPNAAHLALANWEEQLARGRSASGSPRGSDAKNDDKFLLVTQNIDNLHQRAGSKNVLAMHGELLKARCADSGELFDWTDDISLDTPHPNHPGDARKKGRLRPHVVWFGEMPLDLDRIFSAAAKADVFLAIGTSGLVYPAAGIVEQTSPSCRSIEINLDDTPTSPNFDEAIRGRATVSVPEVIAQLMAG